MDSVSELRALTGGTYPLIYVVLIFLASFYFSRKVEKPVVMFPIIFWLLGQPVLDAYYTIEIPGLPFKFHSSRILFLYLFCLLPFVSQKKGGGDNGVVRDKRKVPFEKYIVIFIGLVIFALVLNRDALDMKRILAIPLECITFFLLYLIFKKIITEKILFVIFQVIIFMAVINALIAVIQLVDPFFLRTGLPRIAFGSLYRSFGAFSSEYIFGGFQTIALFVVVSYMKKSWAKMSFILLMCFSIFITFHRMGLIILMVCTFLYIYKFTKKGIGVPHVLVILFLTISIYPAYTIFSSFGESQLVKERLLNDTVSGRFAQFGLVIREMAHYPLGLGSEDNVIYQKIMIKHGHTKSEIGKDGKYHDVGLPVHNGFLSVGIMYGISAMFIFTLLLSSMWKYFYKRASKENIITVIPVISVMVWGLANLSNGIIVFRAYNVLIIAMLVGAFVGAYKKGIIKSN